MARSIGTPCTSTSVDLQVPLEGWLQIVLFVGHYEGYFWRQATRRPPKPPSCHPHSV